MKKHTSFSTRGNRADLGPLTIQRMLPNRYADKVGPFVFLDHVAPAIKETIDRNGMGAHPHRGIATLTYILQGEVEHFDSAGNRGKIYSGGVQWMKAGTGIVHDENFNYDSQTASKYVHGFQFWINLPSKNKAEDPAHLAIQAYEVPKKTLPDGGWVKVIVGNYDGLNSKIPNYAKQFLYHIQLKAGKQFSLDMEDKIEAAAFLPTQKVKLNNVEFDAGEFVEFDRNAGEIEIRNTSENTDADVLLFGGEEYTEPIVAEGPFVMNTMAEIADAYRDFYAGKYGVVNLTTKN
jgi:redox-sensitive bicupin YhaK (pirin superfamily)